MKVRIFCKKMPLFHAKFVILQAEIDKDKIK